MIEIRNNIAIRLISLLKKKINMLLRFLINYLKKKTNYKE